MVIGVCREAKGGQEFRERHSLTYSIWVDREGELYDKFVDNYIPWNAIIDREGKVKYTKVGAEAEKVAEMKAILIDLLN